MGGECGGVSEETWTNENSKMLCKSLGCGNKVLNATKSPKALKVIIKSLHKTKHATNLTQYNFLKYNENSKKKPAYVVCSGNGSFFFKYSDIQKIV